MCTNIIACFVFPEHSVQSPDIQSTILLPVSDLEWPCLGQVQSDKARRVSTVSTCSSTGILLVQLQRYINIGRLYISMSRLVHHGFLCWLWNSHAQTPGKSHQQYNNSGPLKQPSIKIHCLNDRYLKSPDMSCSCRVDWECAADHKYPKLPSGSSCFQNNNVLISLLVTSTELVPGRKNTLACITASCEHSYTKFYKKG